MRRKEGTLMMTKKVRLPFVATLFATVGLVCIPVSAQSSSPVAPKDEQVKAAVNEAYTLFRGDTSGKNADYIPYLAQVDSKLFGIAVVTTDNQVVTLGDVKYSFSIQSISKVYTLAL